MADALTRFDVGTDLDRAVRFHSRERRRSLAGVPEMHRTHHIFGSAMAVASINPASIFPNLSAPVTFRSAIRITPNISFPGEHRGLVFELGGAPRGTALWVQTQGIGFRAGAAQGSGDEAFAFFDNGAELPEGLELDLVAAIRPGDGRVRLWGNGRELARAQATNLTFNTDWSGVQNGSFAAAVTTNTGGEVPTSSTFVPEGFQVIEPLSIYFGQVPRHFV